MGPGDAGSVVYPGWLTAADADGRRAQVTNRSETAQPDPMMPRRQCHRPPTRPPDTPSPEDLATRVADVPVISPMCLAEDAVLVQPAQQGIWQSRHRPESQLGAGSRETLWGPRSRALSLSGAASLE